MDLEDIKNLVIIGYTAWKWKTEYDEKQKSVPKERHPSTNPRNASENK